MSWQDISAWIALITFVAAIVKTVIPLTNAITTLTIKVDTVISRFEEMDRKKHEAHEKIWGHNCNQDKLLMEHETRLHDLDGKSSETKLRGD